MENCKVKQLSYQRLKASSYYYDVIKLQEWITLFTTGSMVESPTTIVSTQRFCEVAQQYSNHSEKKDALARHKESQIST